MVKNKTITIIGAGPAGMGVAYYCNKHKIPYQLFELNTVVGGNCITYNINEFKFDSGAHRFHNKDKEATQLIKNLMKNDLNLINVKSQIYINDKFIDFPLSPLNIIQNLGLLKSSSAFFNLILSKFNCNKITNFQEFAIRKYGSEIANLFLLNYSKKLWGLAPDKLSTEISGRRLKGLNLISLILELLNLQNKKNTHLDGTFYYPNHGIGTIFKQIEKKCGKNNFNLNSNVSSIKHNNNKITSITLNNKNIINVDYLVSSLSINDLIKLLNPEPPKSIIKLSRLINYRNIILVIFLLDKTSVNNNGSMYFPSNEYIFTRIYEPKNRSMYMSPKDKTSLIVEVPCQREDLIWKSDTTELIKNIEMQLINIGFFSKKEVIDRHIKKIVKAYPILELNYFNIINPIKEYLSGFKNLIINGRNGKFEYTHIHDHLRDSKNIVSKLESELNINFN